MIECVEENNLNYEIKENNNISNNNDVDSILNNENFFQNCEFQEQFQFFDEDNLMAQHVDYFENYTLKMLNHICNYYKISKTRLKKEQIIELIIQFENNPDNSVLVYERKRMWHYINELKNDSYFSKFVIFFNS
uniref:Uncharacterized protein n=1 Tax=viral metagenome TaxID=1070528 RepID=A0A6C0CIU9_9ZZZZ